jgi:NAD(P)-dependent dehydrogenase (short-subunit alcohol dehydrogenase family)
MEPAKIAVITGANGGIGKATAIGLAQEKYHVVMLARDSQKIYGVRQIIDEIKKEAGSGQAPWRHSCPHLPGSHFHRNVLSLNAFLNVFPHVKNLIYGVRQIIGMLIYLPQIFPIGEKPGI